MDLALAVIGAAGFRAQPERGPVVIIDSDGPAAGAKASARLREQALASIERYGRSRR